MTGEYSPFSSCNNFLSVPQAMGMTACPTYLLGILLARISYGLEHGFKGGHRSSADHGFGFPAQVRWSDSRGERNTYIFRPVNPHR